MSGMMTDEDAAMAEYYANKSDGKTIDKKVYDEFVEICKTSDCFYFADQKMGHSFFRIFNYRLTSYSEWLVHPLAMWMRGLMFEVTETGKCIRVASRPMKKFFNVNENPIAMAYDLNQPADVYDKLDGSLISTYLYMDSPDYLGNPEKCIRFGLKSKGSLHSEQAKDAMNWISKKENFYFHNHLHGLALAGYTVDMEWTAPQNRVVIGYTEPRLTILGARNNKTGESIPADIMTAIYHEYGANRVGVNNAAEFIKTVAPMKGIEGFVIHLNSGERVKIKTDEYLALHRLKDDVSSPKKVAEVIMNEAIDDFKAAFHQDKLLIMMIERMEEEVKKVFNGLQKKIDEWYLANKELDRKSYAIKGQAEMQEVFGLVMSLYLGKPANLKEYIMKHFDEFFPQTDWYQPTGVSQ